MKNKNHFSNKNKIINEFEYNKKLSYSKDYNILRNYFKSNERTLLIDIISYFLNNRFYALTNKDIAYSTGLSIRTVERLISKLKKENYIKYNREEFKPFNNRKSIEPTEKLLSLLGIKIKDNINERDVESSKIIANMNDDKEYFNIKSNEISTRINNNYVKIYSKKLINKVIPILDKLTHKEAYLQLEQIYKICDDAEYCFIKLIENNSVVVEKDYNDYTQYDTFRIKDEYEEEDKKNKIKVYKNIVTDTGVLIRITNKDVYKKLKQTSKKVNKHIMLSTFEYISKKYAGIIEDNELIEMIIDEALERGCVQ